MKRWFAMICLLLMSSVALVKAPATLAQDQSVALVDFHSWLLNVGDVDVYLNGELLAANVASYAYTTPLAAGDYTVAMTRAGAGLDAPLVGPITATVEAGHLYVIGAYGVVGQDNADLRSFDLGSVAAVGERTPLRSAIFNLLGNSQSVDYWVNDRIAAADLAPGTTTFLDVPVESMPFGEAFSQTGGTVALDWRPNPAPDVKNPARDNLIIVHVLWGQFPGERYKDYSAPSIVLYDGMIDVVDAGSIAVGESKTVQIERGQRHEYRLTVDTLTAVDITLRADRSADPYLYLYDSNNRLLYRNDELSPTDDSFDAGLMGTLLQPGTYTVVAASLGDDTAGAYSLNVAAVQPAEGAAG